MSMPTARAAESVSQPPLPDAWLSCIQQWADMLQYVCGQYKNPAQLIALHCTCTSMHPFLLVCILYNLLTRRAVLLLLHLQTITSSPYSCHPGHPTTSDPLQLMNMTVPFLHTHCCMQLVGPACPGAAAGPPARPIRRPVPPRTCCVLLLARRH